MVCVLNKDGKPLMPTNRHGRIRKLLNSGKAIVVRRNPFTVQLMYAKRGSDYECCCPVCGKQNKRQTFYENGIGTVEIHYFCSGCGYAEEMAYSPCYTTFVKGGKIKDRIKRFWVHVRNWKKSLRIRLSDNFDAKLGKYL